MILAIAFLLIVVGAVVTPLAIAWLDYKRWERDGR